MKNKITKILGGAAVFTTAIAPVAVLASCNKHNAEFEVTVDGAEFDKASSSLNLNQESKLVLKVAKDYEIDSIETVKVGETTLTTDDYSFQQTDSTLTIKASAMTSMKIYVKVVAIKTLVTWKDGWYAYEKTTESSTLYSNYADVEFELLEEPAAGEEISFEIETQPMPEQLSLVHGSMTRSGKKITIPLRFKTTYTFIEFGTNAYYDITFTCKKDGETVWTYKTKNCYFYLLTSLKNATTWIPYPSKTPTHADCEVSTTVNVPTILFDTGELILKTEVVETTERPVGKHGDVVVELGQSVPYKSAQKLYQKIQLVNIQEDLADGDTFEFTIKFTLSLKQFPERPIDFVFEGVKYIYKTH